MSTVLRSMDTGPRAVLRAVLIVGAVVLLAYVLYLLRRPIGWLVVAAFIAIAISGPVEMLDRRMPRGLAIATVYSALIAVPLVLAALLIPPLVSQGEDLVNNVPSYADDVTAFVNDNETLRNLDDDYDLTGKLEEEAAKLPGKIGGATQTLSNIGVGLVNSIFALVTILILSVFMVSGGRGWVNSLLDRQEADQRERMGRAFASIGTAIGSYVGGAILQATIAGFAAFVMLSILGAPFAGALALIVAFGDLIPVVGATIASALVAVVLIFVNFPVALIVWAIYAVLYQQIENYLIQPQIQRRAVAVEPIVILIAVLFGSTLFGVPGALLAIPTAASLQIAGREWMDYRRAVDIAAPSPNNPITG